MARNKVVNPYATPKRVTGIDVNRVKNEIIEYLRINAAINLSADSFDIKEGAERVYTFSIERGDKVASVGIQLPASPATIALACGSIYAQINP